MAQDPVILPDSNITVDRATIERHLMSSKTDPFNRSPLTLDAVKPDTALKALVFLHRCHLLGASELRVRALTFRMLAEALCTSLFHRWFASAAGM